MRILLIVFLGFSYLGNSQVTPPYFSNFDNLPNDTMGWYHFATVGTDDWEVGLPTGDYFNNAYSNPNAWVTNLDTTCAENSVRFLVTPFFNLSNLSIEHLINFRFRITKPSSSEFKVEYRKGTLGTWAILPSTTFKENFDNSGFFSNTTGGTFVYSARNLDNLTGALDSIQFRFSVTTSIVSNANQEGWIIDDFEIRAAERNFTAYNLDTLIGMHENFLQINFNHPVIVTNEINDGTVPIARKFYWSNDPIFDAGDTLLYSASTSISQYYRDYPINLSSNIPLPINLEAGTYYLFYFVDPDNLKPESDETDNIGMAVAIIEPVYEVPYLQNFDTTTIGWLSSEPNFVGTYWKFGDPNSWNIEDSHSGNNAWSATKGTGTSYSDYLESPYLNLTTADSNCFCFFYKTTMAYSDGFLDFWKPHLMTTGNSEPLFTTHAIYRVALPYSRIYPHWDAFCVDLNDYDDQNATKFRIRREWANGHASDGVTVDDIYLGSPLPDYSLEGFKTALYTNSLSLSDTIHFYFFNSGMDTAPSSEIKFYWSSDSLLQLGTDMFLGSQLTTAMTDTNFYATSFIYNKEDLSTEKYYILYSIDDNNLVTEMREYNNIGFFRIFQTQSASLPYYNDFETQISSWRHESDLGIDNWNWDEPQGTYINAPFSGTKAWFTYMAPTPSINCESHLYTPIFDLTELNHPVMEFNLSVTPYSMSNLLAANMSYSIDGGASWQILNHTSSSSKRLYTHMKYDLLWGDDEEEVLLANGNYVYNEAPNFTNDQIYIGRNYRDTSKVVVDLAFLQGYKNVQFRISFVNTSAIGEGIMLDDFKIIEAFSDLKLEYRKHLLVNSQDQWLKLYYNVYNDGNKHTNGVQTGLFLSEDSLLSSDDFELSDDYLLNIKPYESELGLYQIYIGTVSNYSTYNYLIFKLDKNNFYPESNEDNNVDFYYLDMDSLDYSSYPYTDNFDGEVINGWNWEIQGGFDVDGPRFRHKTILGEPTNFPSNGAWFTDPMDLLGYYSYNWDDYGIYYLESPAFDFSQINTANVEFDFVCVGSQFGGSDNTSGGNMQYSIDGGSTWETLYNGPGPLGTNWYSSGGAITLASINYDYGWFDVDEWTHATYDLSFLKGNPNVRLRYQFSSDFRSNSMAMHGFRLDNFELETSSLDLEMLNADEIILTTISSNNFQCNYQPKNNNSFSVSNLKSYFYWSNDSIFDPSDTHIHTVNHWSMAGYASPSLSTTIIRPDTIAQLEYYLFSIIDGDQSFVEISESNNVKKTKVIFDATNLNIAESNDFISVVDGYQTISLYFNGINLQVGELKIFDSQGRLVYTNDSGIKDDSYFIDKSKFSAGIYYLSIINNNNGAINKIICY